MIKITFEVSEDFIRENASLETATAKMNAENGKRTLNALLDMIGFKRIAKQIDEGKTEFLVTPDKLDDRLMELYNFEIGDICMLASFSETDCKDE